MVGSRNPAAGRRRLGRRDIGFDVFAYTTLVLAILVCLIPFLHVIAKSFSAETEVIAGKVFLLPRGVNTRAYELVLSSTRFWRAFGASAYLVVMGTFVTTLSTIFVSYAVSRKRLVGRGLVVFLFIFTMLFNGGLIPTYLVVRNVGLIDTFWALILPNLVVAFNMIILRNYFATIPDSIEESAKMDGASNARILFSMMIPLAMPSIATISLFTAVELWNSYFAALIYINDRNKYPLQIYLREIIVQADPEAMSADLMMKVAQESVRGATVVAATLPILVVYPFLQRFFVTGMTVGAVKQ